MDNPFLKKYSLKDRLIIALDIDSLEEIKKIVELLGEDVSFYKVGLKSFLFTQGEVVDYLQSLNKKVFLDLKFYDIPETVKTASLFPIKKGVDLFTIHASMGYEGLKGISEAILANKSTSIPLAVTVLTSFSEEEFIDTYKTDLSLTNSVVHLAKIAFQAKIPGVVCSAKEASLIKNYIDKRMVTVCPGIRLESDSKDDQSRIDTPYNAIKSGADFIVVGRSVTNSKKIKEAVKIIMEQIEQGFNDRKAE